MNNCFKKSKTSSPEKSLLPPNTTRFQSVPGDNLKNYVIEAELGKGAFGNVFKVKAQETENCYAIKVIKNEERFIRAAKMEATILKHLLDHKIPHVCQIVDCFYYSSNQLNHPCFVFDLYHSDLYTALCNQKKEFSTGFDHTFIKDVVRQVFLALSHLNAHRIIHADLKPENIMLENSKTNAIKIIDFGSSCFQQSKIHTYIQSRYYRSPEVMLGRGYNTQIDVWSLGCIIFELLTTTPLFRAKNTKHLIMMHTELLNVPSVDFLDKCQKGHEYFTYVNGKYIPNCIKDTTGVTRIPGSTNIQSLINQQMSQDYVHNGFFNDLIMQCISYLDNRITPLKALDHEYLKTNL